MRPVFGWHFFALGICHDHSPVCTCISCITLDHIGKLDSKDLKYIVVIDIAFIIILSTLPLMIVVVVLLRFKVILLLLCLLLCCGGISNELGKCKCGV